MTATEKYLAMNNEFCKLRDAIYESNVVEANEDENVQKITTMLREKIIEVGNKLNEQE